MCVKARLNLKQPCCSVPLPVWDTAASRTVHFWNAPWLLALHAGATRLRQLGVEANPDRPHPVPLHHAEALDGGWTGPCAVEAWAVMQVQGCGMMLSAETRLLCQHAVHMLRNVSQG